MKTKIFTLFAAVSLTYAGSTIAQQDLTLPEVSQKSKVTQTIGLTDITVVYHSPLVNGRKIWDALVPYGQVWRAGANENTTISFTDDVMVENKALPAGTYGLHMIPNATEWTIIFSKNSTSWGSYFYKEGEDALRVSVKPTTAKAQDWLDYNFKDRTATGCKLTLAWETVRVPIGITVDVNAVTLKHIREQLRNVPGFTWQGWQQAAHYCIVNKTNYEEAMGWITRSVRMNENFTNMSDKAQLYTLMGKTSEAAETNKKVVGLMESASEAEVNAFGYQMVAAKDMTTALDVFKMNVKKHPNSWNAYDSLGEAYGMTGDKTQAMANYKTALDKAPADQHDRIKKIIAGMGKS